MIFCVNVCNCVWNESTLVVITASQLISLRIEWVKWKCIKKKERKAFKSYFSIPYDYTIDNSSTFCELHRNPLICTRIKIAFRMLRRYYRKLLFKCCLISLIRNLWEVLGEIIIIIIMHISYFFKCIKMHSSFIQVSFIVTHQTPSLKQRYGTF